MSNVLNFGGLMNFYCFASDITRLILSLLLSLLVLSFALWRNFLLIFLLSLNFSGFALYLYGSLHNISITSLLDVSIEWIFRRCWMLCSDLRTKHWEFYIQLHSFFLAIFRYTCLFHENFLLRFNLTPNVSIITCIITSITNYKSQNSMPLDQNCLNLTTFVLKNA